MEPLLHCDVAQTSSKNGAIFLETAGTLKPSTCRGTSTHFGVSSGKRVLEEGECSRTVTTLASIFSLVLAGVWVPPEFPIYDN